MLEGALQNFVTTKHKIIKTTSANFLIPCDTLLNRYYHDNRNFTRLLTMLSNEVVARARQLVGEHVLENLLAVGNCFLY